VGLELKSALRLVVPAWPELLERSAVMYRAGYRQI